MESFRYELEWPSNISAVQDDFFFIPSDSCFSFFSVENGEEFGVIKGSTRIRNLIFDREQKSILFFDSDSSHAEILNLENLNSKYELKPHNGVQVANASRIKSHGKDYILSQIGPKKAVLIDIQSGEKFRTLNDPNPKDFVMYKGEKYNLDEKSTFLEVKNIRYILHHIVLIYGPMIH